MFKSLYLISTLALIKVTSAAMGNSRDVSTYANIDEVYAMHMDLDILVDFPTKTLSGTVEITFNQTVDNVESVFLDSEGMYITNVEYGFGTLWTPVTYFITRPNNNLGNAVEVVIPTKNPALTTFQLRLNYVTNDQTTAISWLKPSQTAGGKYSYLFTQCEDIACRSVAPMQDTPAIKVTYTAIVTVETPYVVHMSANKTGNTTSGNMTVYNFENTIKMPSYLIALAVGNLEETSMGERTSVITEPEKMAEVVDVL